MALHTRLGKTGEELAARYLISKGYTILHRNWRHSHYEIDIIALLRERLHFIEVKLRRSHSFGLPEQSVSKKKLDFLLRAVSAFLDQNPQYKDFRLDILSITLMKNAPPDYFLIEDVY